MNNNALGLLRFVLAVLVSLVHIYNLSGDKTFKLLDQYGLANISVNIFFVLSGFLMPQSFKHSKSVVKFYAKRFFRIYIGYFIVVLGIPLLAFAVSRCDFEAYFTTELLRYYIFNLLTLNFIKPDLSCLFQDHALTAINGSLWSIKIELMFYLLVPFVYNMYDKIKDKVSQIWFSVLLVVLGMAINYSIYYMYVETGSSFWDAMQNQLPSKLYFFVSGWALYYIIHNENRYMMRLVWGSFIVSSSVYVLGIPTYEFIQLPIACGLIALFYKIKFIRFDAFIKTLGGCSYHIYLLHFPILQILISLEKKGVGLSIFWCSVAIVGIFAYLLYRIETQVLAKLNHKMN